MKTLFTITCLLFVCSCAQLGFISSPAKECEIQEHPDKLKPNTPSMPSGLLAPERSISELMLDRLRYCAVQSPLNSPVTHARDGEASIPPINADSPLESRLNRLLLASCEPSGSKEELNQMLLELTAEGVWPAEYAAFFDMLLTGQRAYAAVEKLYENMKEEHRKTIEGLSNIETQIELQQQGL